MSGWLYVLLLVASTRFLTAGPARSSPREVSRFASVTPSSAYTLNNNNNTDTTNNDDDNNDNNDTTTNNNDNNNNDNDDNDNHDDNNNDTDNDTNDNNDNDNVPWRPDPQSGLLPPVPDAAAV